MRLVHTMGASLWEWGRFCGAVGLSHLWSFRGCRRLLIESTGSAGGAAGAAHRRAARCATPTAPAENEEARTGTNVAHAAHV